MKLLKIAGLTSFFSIYCSWASQIIRYEGIAMDGDRISYVEKHIVEYSHTGKLLGAATTYLSHEGKPIAELKSDFRDSLTVPSHIIKDFRTGSVEGLRRDQNKIILFDRDKANSERIRAIEEIDAHSRMLVACQGLNYYLLENLEGLSLEQELPLRFLIPGKLDYYDFKMKKVKESKEEGIVEFEIAVQNWFLKLFAPKLFVKYDKIKKHIVWYKGISNIKDDLGKNQIVTITYKY